MSNITITDIDNGPVIVEAGTYDDGTLEFAGDDTYAEGTILSRNTSNGNLQLYVQGGVSNGNGIPVAILTYALTRTGGAGTERCRAMFGSAVVNKARLIEHAGATLADADYDLLRQAGINPIDVDQLAKLDNPNNP